MLMYFTAIWNILLTFGIFYDYLVHFVFLWYIFPDLVSCTEKNLAALTGTQAKPTPEAPSRGKLEAVARLVGFVAMLFGFC
jgi:hypothetical protein